MSLRKLAGQTAWYGISNIAARLLTYLLTPYLTYTLIGPAGQVEFGKQAFFYALFPVLNILYTYGMETSYFRFSMKEDSRKVYQNILSLLGLSTLVFTLLILVFDHLLAEFAEIPGRTEYIYWAAGIIGLDALAALPFARLRLENRPRKYALIKVVGIVVFVGLIVTQFQWGGAMAAEGGDHFMARWYDRHWGLGFILFANLVQAALCLILLYKEWIRDFRFSLDPRLLGQILPYGLPILLAGFAGTINDSLNRVLFQKLYPADPQESLRQLGFFTAALRLSIVMNLMIQAFRLAAEPYFFSISAQENARLVYARVMKWFLILVSIAFLHVTLFIDLWQYFISPEYRQALDLVPVLLFAYMLFGVYTNLTIWYKLTDRTRYGAYIMGIGAVVTGIICYLGIPVWGYYACALAMVASHGVMVVLAYVWGQKYYHIPYRVPYLLRLLMGMGLLFFFHWGLIQQVDSLLIRLGSASLLFLAYLYWIYRLEREEISRFPFWNGGLWSRFRGEKE